VYGIVGKIRMLDPNHQTTAHTERGAQPNHRLFDEPFLRKLERLSILSRRAMAGQLQGERRSPKRGQSVEFADFRPYAPGDDFRRIDWNAYARLERFFIKLFVEEQDLTVHLLVDASPSMDWGEPNKLRYAARAAGALGYVALSGLDRVTVTALGHAAPDANSGGYFPPRRGKQQAMALFSFLQALIQPSTTVPPNHGPHGTWDTPQSSNTPGTLAPRLRHYATAVPRPGPLLLLSDLLDDGWADGLRDLAARGFEVTVLHVLSPDEVDPGASSWLSTAPTRDFKLLDVETGLEVEITADFETLQRYREGLAVWREELRRFCGARGMHYVPIETSLPFEELLFALLRRRGVLV
jgi:uncharacterized protein (DUF58 family)